MGVITVTDIDYGHIFGPFPSHVTPADPAYLIGMLTNDKRPEGLMLKVRGRSYPVNTPVPALNNCIQTNDRGPEGLMLKARGRSYPVNTPVPALNNSIQYTLTRTLRVCC